MNYIHPTAVVHPLADLGEENYVGPFCYIGPNVKIGDHNRFEAYVAVGTPPEHKEHFNTFGPVVIHNDCVFREFVTIQGGTNKETKVYSHVVALRHSHISHDTIVEENVNISCDVLIGGHSTIMIGANLGLGCVIHQRQVIGSYAMIGMNSTITRSQNILPGRKYAGSPAKDIGRNQVGLERADVSDSFLDLEIIRFYKLKT